MKIPRCQLKKKYLNTNREIIDVEFEAQISRKNTIWHEIVRRMSLPLIVSVAKTLFEFSICFSSKMILVRTVNQPWLEH